MYQCSNCGQPMAYPQDRCPGCGVLLSGVRCQSCRYVGGKQEFISNGHKCPKCDSVVHIPGTAPTASAPERPVTTEEPKAVTRRAPKRDRQMMHLPEAWEEFYKVIFVQGGLPDEEFAVQKSRIDQLLQEAARLPVETLHDRLTPLTPWLLDSSQGAGDDEEPTIVVPETSRKLCRSLMIIAVGNALHQALNRTRQRSTLEGVSSEVATMQKAVKDSLNAFSRSFEERLEGIGSGASGSSSGSSYSDDGMIAREPKPAFFQRLFKKKSPTRRSPLDPTAEFDQAFTEYRLVETQVVELNQAVVATTGAVNDARACYSQFQLSLISNPPQTRTERRAAEREARRLDGVNRAAEKRLGQLTIRVGNLQGRRDRLKDRVRALGLKLGEIRTDRLLPQFSAIERIEDDILFESKSRFPIAPSEGLRRHFPPLDPGHMGTGQRVFDEIRASFVRSKARPPSTS